MQWAMLAVADGLADEGQYELVNDFERALDSTPIETMNSYAYRLAMCRNESWRDYDRAIRSATRACQIVSLARLLIAARSRLPS